MLDSNSVGSPSWMPRKKLAFLAMFATKTMVSFNENRWLMMGVSPSMVMTFPHKHWQTSSHYPLPSKLQGDGPPVYVWPTPLIYLWLQYIYYILYL